MEKPTCPKCGEEYEAIYEEEIVGDLYLGSKFIKWDHKCIKDSDEVFNESKRVWGCQGFLGYKK